MRSLTGIGSSQCAATRFAAGAELLVVDVGDLAGVVAAHRAVRIAAQRDLVEARLERVDQQQPADQRLADVQQQLQRLGGLQRAHDAGQHAEDAALGAARGHVDRRRLGEEAAVAGAVVRLEHRHLALEPEDRGVDDRDVVLHARVVEQVPGREVVRAVDDQVVARQDAVDVRGGEALVVRHHLDVGVQRGQRLRAPTRSSPCRRDPCVCRICRCRFESSTMSSSMMPIVPTPAAAR